MARKSDTELRADLLDTICTIPSVDPDQLEVLVDDGVVTLNGRVDTHQTRFHVERMARRVEGIRGMNINIRPTVNPLRSHIQSNRKFGA
jgi:osmotically-inducible protein OsmY